MRPLGHRTGMATPTARQKDVRARRLLCRCTVVQRAPPQLWARTRPSTRYLRQCARDRLAKRLPQQLPSSTLVVANAPFSIAVPLSNLRRRRSRRRRPSVERLLLVKPPLRQRRIPHACHRQPYAACCQRALHRRIGTTIVVTSSATPENRDAVANTTLFLMAAHSDDRRRNWLRHTPGANTSTSVTINNDDLPTVNVTLTTASVNDTMARHKP